MKKEEAVKLNAELDRIVDDMRPTWEAAVEARDNAQKVLNEIQAFKKRISDQQLSNIKSATD